jgi:hypothetical protein
MAQKENYRPLFSVNVGIKILNKILANQIQQHIKKRLYIIKLVAIQGCKSD